jgi:hypothetical protein
MASKYIQKFPVPEGFPEILHDLSKEILRNQPTDIIEFSALYFKCLQEGLVLDYKKKGKNIPCDYKPKIPKKSSKEELASGQKIISRQDQQDHVQAVNNSKKLNNMHDAARVNMDETNKKSQQVKQEVEQQIDFNPAVEKDVSPRNKDELLNLSSSFIENIMSRKFRSEYSTVYIYLQILKQLKNYGNLIIMKINME